MKQLLIVLIFSLASFGFVDNVHGQCNHPDDYTALRALYLSTDGDNWTDKTGWPTRAQFLANPNPPVGTDMSGWYGIECNLDTIRRVICLDMDGRVDCNSSSITGNNLNGVLTPELNFLRFLNTLNLSYNSISGSIPDLNLPDLRNLFLRKLQLSDSIPNFQLPSLQNLYLEGNQLIGNIPNFNLPNLNNLSLDNNKLKGTIPNFGLPKLRHLFLHFNQLSGTIPNFNLPDLEVLTLFNNQLTGSIPNLNLPSLTNLVLDNNQLSGTIPNFDLPNLTILSLSNNQLTGSIPNFDLPNLYELSLYGNQLTGTIPEFNLKNLYTVYFSYNNLSGCIPINYLSYCDSIFVDDIHNPGQFVKVKPSIFLNNNPNLPWQGDFSQFCATDGSQQAQIGAPCNNYNSADGDNDVIQDDCRCGTYNCIIMDTIIQCQGEKVLGLASPFNYQIAFDPPYAGYYDTLCQCVKLSDTFTGYANVYTDQPTGLSCFKILVNESPSVQLSASDTICLGQSTTISITNPDSFLGGTFNWSPLGSGTSFVATPIQTTQYSVTVTNNGCVSVARVLINVNPLPTPGISGATSYCAGESTELTSSGGSTYVWSGPNGFSSNLASTGQISNPGTYIVTVTNSNFCTASSAVTISEGSFITLQLSPLTICDNSLDSLNAGDGFDSYEWFDDTNNSIGTSQYLQVTTAGNFSVSVTDGNCIGGGNGVVINNETPMLVFPDSAEVCIGNNGAGSTTFDFVAIADTMDGQWFNINNANIDISNWGNVDFSTVGSAGIFDFVYIANTAIAPCLNPRDTLQVFVRYCDCPNPSIRPIGPLCNSSITPYNLNNTFINQTPPLPGDWTVEAPSPSPFPTITGNTIAVTGITPGTYTLRYTYNPPLSGNCPKFIENILVVSPSPLVASRNTSLCNADIGIGTTMVNLDTLLIGLIEPSPGTWLQVDGATPFGTLPNIDVTGMSRDTLRFQYTTTAVAPCVPRTAIVEVIIKDCECPSVSLVDDELCNGSMTLLDLEDPNRFDINPNTLSGSWTAQAPLVITNGKFINPFGVISSATPYNVSFTLNGTFPPDCQTVFTKTVRITNQPLVEKLRDGEACSASTGNGATDLSLTSLLKPGYTTGGTWTQISPAAPQLTIPSSSIVEFIGQLPGTEFVFSYIVNPTN